uniref:SFRICE_005489 n=1 Tax=Spodoptera frugiperda TaxID=7108 RepID=A0A2H1VZT5_SPOFR
MNAFHVLNLESVQFLDKNLHNIMEYAVGKRPDGSPDGVTSSLPAFWGLRIYGLLGNRGLGRLERGVIGPPHSQEETQRKRCFTSVFCEAMVLLLRVASWISHN